MKTTAKREAMKTSLKKQASLEWEDYGDSFAAEIAGGGWRIWPARLHRNP